MNGKDSTKEIFKTQPKLRIIIIKVHWLVLLKELKKCLIMIEKKL